MSRRHAGPALAPVPLLLLVLAGCGGMHATLPACAQRTAISAAPAVHLPTGSVVYGRRTSLGATLWSVVTPGSVESVVAAYKSKLHADGYAVTGGEVDEHDAEAEFGRGRSIVRLRLAELHGCSGAIDARLATLRRP